MDAGKLIESLELLEADERDFTIGAKLEEIRNLIAQNSNEEQNQTITTKLEELESVVQLSRAVRFSKTELSVLEQIDAEACFGSGLLKSLAEITNMSRSYELNTRFKDFHAARTDKFNKLMKLKGAMIDNGVPAYKQEGNEVALSIPDAGLSVETTASYLKEFSAFLRSLQECAVAGDERPEPAQIVRVSRGSLDVFAMVDPATVQMILDVLSDVATIYVASEEIKKRTGKSVLTDGEQTKVDDLMKEISKKRVEEFLENTTNKLCKKDDNDLKARVRKHLRVLLKWIPMGIHIEVVVKKTVDPVETKQEPKQLKARQQELAILSRVKEMYSLPPERLQLPVPSSEGEDEALPAKEAKKEESKAPEGEATGGKE